MKLISQQAKNDEFHQLKRKFVVLFSTDLLSPSINSSTDLRALFYVPGVGVGAAVGVGVGDKVGVGLSSISPLELT